MTNIKKLRKQIRNQGFIPLFYNASLEESRAVVSALYDAGIRIVEYTNRGENAISNFRKLIKVRDKEWPALLLAAGTIKSVKDAKAYCKAGADFIICPGVVRGVAKRVEEAGLLWIPGCLTTTEIIMAEQCGARLVKIFPGDLLGSAYIKSIKEIFPDLEFMPTGGIDITKEKLAPWFRAGVAAVGAGTKLLTKDIMANKDYERITALAKELMETIHSIKTPV